MFDVDLVREVLRQIHEACRRIERRFAPVRQPDEFLATDEGLDRLDAISLHEGHIHEGSCCVEKIPSFHPPPLHPHGAERLLLPRRRQVFARGHPAAQGAERGGGAGGEVRSAVQEGGCAGGLSGGRRQLEVSTGF